MRNATRAGLWSLCVCALLLQHARAIHAAETGLPAPWITGDVGAVGQSGSASLASGVFTVAGAGADIWGTTDAFRAVLQPVAGDAQIVVRVSSLQPTNTFAKAGVMLRSSVASGAADVILDLRPTGAIEFMSRPTDDAATVWLAGAAAGAPAWLKLARTGAVVAGYLSTDGTAWTLVGSTSLPSGAGDLLGLAVTSHDATQLNTATFDHVTLTTNVPAPWASRDIGTVGPAGGASASNGVFTVRGAGADIWGTADAFQSVLQPMTDDAQIVARVSSLLNTNTYAKAGLMVRASVAPDAANVILDVRPNGAIEFMSRSASGAATAWLAGATQATPVWLKLTRGGGTITGYISADGTAWTRVGSTTLTLTAAPLAGLAVTSHDTTQLTTATFDAVTLTAGVPAPWVSQDIGPVGQAGSASSADGVFTVRGAGADIWGTSDAFQSVLQTVAGDVQITARVSGLQNTNTYAKAGVMLRATAAPDAADVILDVRPNGAVEFMSRQAGGAATAWLGGGTEMPPAWLRLARAGATVTAYVSADGTAWTPLGSTSPSLGDAPLAGLAVTSHDTTQLNAATFDNVSAGVLPVVTPMPGLPTALIPSAGATGVMPGTALAWNASDAVSYDVRLGATNPPPTVAVGLATPAYVPSGLQMGAPYYWQVVARNAAGSTTGPAWSFTTAAPPPLVPPASYNAIADRVAYAKPPLPQLGAAGFSFADPTFGSRLLRVTDGHTRPGLVNRSFRVPSNAHLAAWNATSTAFYVVSNDGTVIPYSFDPSTMTASRFQATSSGNGGLTLAFYVEPQFSLNDPNLIYGVESGGNNRTIGQYDFSTGTYSTVLDLDTVAGGLSGTYVGGIMSGGVPSENLLAFFGGGSQDAHYYALWAPLGHPSAFKLLNSVTSTINGRATNVALNFHLHSAQIDKGGRFVFLYPAAVDLAPPRQAAQVYIWDTSTDAVTPLTPNLLPGGHDAAGFGVWVNQACCTSSTWDAAQWQFRSLATPAQVNDLISPVQSVKEVYLADHTTWNNAQPDRLVPVISSTYRYGSNSAPWRAWDDEIIGIDTTNGVGGTVWRFAHHRSAVGSDADPTVPYFWYEPMPNVSPDGQWVIFTSNWEKTLGQDSAEGTARQDVFLVQLAPQR